MLVCLVELTLDVFGLCLLQMKASKVELEEAGLVVTGLRKLGTGEQKCRTDQCGVPHLPVIEGSPRSILDVFALL